MSEDKRRHVRTPIVCRIRIVHPRFGEMMVKTRDISDGGVFVVLDDAPALPVGDIVQGQVQGLVADAPVLDMEVVRVEPTGVGLKFVQYD